MSDNLKKYSFQDLLKQGQIRIPKIQRDYAQGRQNQKVNEIRKVFIHTLMLVVKGKRIATELDFVYGSNNMEAFEPLDGQQRLTTLFLLHWMMGVDLRSAQDKKHAIFTYETRNTSKEFCDELVQHDAIQFVNEARQKTISTGKSFTPSKIIKGRDWFKWEWKYDPTILSMLVMIDAIYDEMGSDWDKDLTIYRENMENITFNLLNLGEFGLSNELFIKMNARGKQLSDFDKLKSTLEEELQLQQKEFDVNNNMLTSEGDEENWRTLMDGAWVDLFWHKYARKRITDTEFFTDDEKKDTTLLNAAKLSELQFKKLLLRLIALQIFEKNPSSETLREAAYQLDENRIDNLITTYTNSLTDLRSDEQNSIVPEEQITLSFKRLIDDFNLLIYKDSNDVFCEISYLLPQVSDKNDFSLFDSFLEKKVPNDVELIFYGMLLFLREFPPQKDKKENIEKYAWYFEKTQHQAWLKNLEDWVRSLRNILLNDNNNQRIDKILFSMEATQSLKKLASDFVNFVDSRALDLEIDRTIVLQFLQSLKNTTYIRLDNQSLLEEIDKADLKLNDIEWYSSIEKVENHHYLWGQIRSLLSWSDKDRPLFDDYGTRLLSLLDYIEKDSLKYYAAILAFSDDCWRESNRLFQYNKDRDNSFKRYLREYDKERKTYGSIIKSLIDYWMLEYTNYSVEQFLDALITKSFATAEPWVNCMLKFPNILDEAWNKRIFKSKGYVILAQRKTPDSHCFDPILVYLRETCKANGFKESSYKLYDSKADYAHGFELKANGHKYLVLWSGDGLYSIQVDEISVLQEISASEMLTYMENIVQTFLES